MLKLRTLERDELILVSKIDRAEVVDQIYEYNSGELVVKDEGFKLDGFPEGDVEEMIVELTSIYDKKGIVVGAFYNDEIVGITSIENRLFGKDKNKINMGALYVNNKKRGLGIGKGLIIRAKEEAKKLGGEILYISATASKNTVDFYCSQGAKLSKDVDSYLLNKEPDDIQLEIVL